MKTVKVGFVGAGGNATGHMNRVSAVEGAEIVGVCDVSEERARTAAENFGANAYTDHHALLDEEELDAVYVSVPPFAHTDAEILAVQKGAAVFVEKPVALSIEKGLEVQEAIEKAGAISCVGYQLRYVESVDRARDFLEGRTVGMVTSNRWGGVPGTPWWRVMAQSGGQIVEQTTHQVDMIRYLTGEVTEVYANYALRLVADMEGLDVPDVMATTFKLANGGVGALTSSCAMVNGGGKGDLEIMADKTILRWGHASISAVPGEHPELDAPLAARPSIDEVFIQAVASGDGSKIRSPYLDGLKSLDVTLAMNESAATGKPVAPYFARWPE